MNIPINEHADEGDLLRYVDGELDELEVEELERHISACTLCRDRYDDLAAASDKLAAFLKKADYEPRALSMDRTQSARAWWGTPWARAAAVVALLLGLTVPLGAYLAVKDHEEPVERPSLPARPTEAPSARSVGDTPFGTGTDTGSDMDKGLQAETLARNGNIDAALDLIATISSDMEAANALRLVTDNRDLTDAQWDRVFAICDDISSDMELGQLLRNMLQNSKLTSHMLEGMLQASLGISSDMEMTEFLMAFTGRQPLAPRFRPAYLAAAQTVASDVEAARLLEAYFNTIGRGGDQSMDRANFETIAEIANGIASDVELRTVLDRLVDRPDQYTLDEAEAMLDISLGIASDFEMAEFLTHFASRVRIESQLRPSFLAALNTIASDSEMGRVLGSYVELDLSQDELADALTASQSIASDFELANLLVEIAGRYDLDGVALSRFRAAAATISSDNEAARVARALR